MGTPYTAIESPADRAALFARLRAQSGATVDTSGLDDPLVGTSEAAAVIGLAPSTLAKARSRGLPVVPHVRVRNRIKYRLSDLLNFLDAARQPARSCDHG